MSFPFSEIAPEPKANAALLVADAVDRRRPDDPTARDLTAQVRADAAGVAESSGPKHEKELTAELDQRDAERDASYSALCMLVQGWSVLPGDPARQAVAARLYEKLVPDTLGFLYGSMHTESTILKERVAVLESPEGAAAVEALGLTALIKSTDTRSSTFSPRLTRLRVYLG